MTYVLVNVKMNVIRVRTLERIVKEMCCLSFFICAAS
jgi:hypothetical protein